jgi:hypothetical protein
MNCHFCVAPSKEGEQETVPQDGFPRKDPELWGEEHAEYFNQRGG